MPDHSLRTVQGAAEPDFQPRKCKSTYPLDHPTRGVWINNKIKHVIHVVLQTTCPRMYFHLFLLCLLHSFCMLRVAVGAAVCLRAHAAKAVSVMSTDLV